MAVPPDGYSSPSVSALPYSSVIRATALVALLACAVSQQAAADVLHVGTSGDYAPF